MAQAAETDAGAEPVEAEAVQEEANEGKEKAKAKAKGKKRSRDEAEAGPSAPQEHAPVEPVDGESPFLALPCSTNEGC